MTSGYRVRDSRVFASASIVAACVVVAACHSHRGLATPSVEFTQLPPSAPGDGDVSVNIAGRVKGARPGQQIVVFARSGMWWVQHRDNPFTPIQPDSSWKNTIHPGSAYAALLVDRDYHPPATTYVLPKLGGPIFAIAVADGEMLVHQAAKTMHFSGYEWDVRQSPGPPKASENVYDPSNAWVDKNGFLHLRISKSGVGWTCADLSLSHSLGYGSYRFVVQDISRLEPAAVLSISTRDDSGPFREMDIQISRWGDAAANNAQYVVQPYFVPANMVRFMAPAGTLAYSIAWYPERASFQTLKSSGGSGGAEMIAAHTFTSGVPAPQTEFVRLNFYVFHEFSPLLHDVEVIVEKFEYLP